MKEEWVQLKSFIKGCLSVSDLTDKSGESTRTLNNILAKMQELETRVSCKECVSYHALDSTCGICGYWTPSDRVHCDSTCARGILKISK